MCGVALQYLQRFSNFHKLIPPRGNPLQRGCRAHPSNETGSDSLKVGQKAAILPGVLPSWLTDQA